MKKLLLYTALLFGSIVQAQTATIKTEPLISSNIAETAVAVAFMQSTHSIAVSWTPSSDAAANPTLAYQVYRANSLCTATSLVFVKIGSTTTPVLVFNDLAVPPGNYCYKVTSLLNGAESVDSNTAPAVILPGAPGGVLAKPTS